VAFGFPVMVCVPKQIQLLFLLSYTQTNMHVSKLIDGIRASQGAMEWDDSVGGRLSTPPQHSKLHHRRDHRLLSHNGLTNLV
jgi:hypothetical protein